MIPDVLRSNKNMGKLQTEGELARASEKHTRFYKPTHRARARTEVPGVVTATRGFLRPGEKEPGKVTGSPSSDVAR